MATKLYAIACKGLADPLVTAPLEQLIAWLNIETHIFFNLVGGLDPHPLFEPIMEMMVQAHQRGETVIFLGHSMGGMAAFYAADRLRSLGIRSPLFIGLDATDWASNAAGVPPWTRPATTPPAGHWYAPDNIDKFIYIHQDAPPGGGVAFLAPGNKHTVLKEYHLPQESHIGIVNAQLTRSVILSALRELS